MSQEEPSAHPGKILLEQVMRPLGVSRNKLAREIGVPVGRISDIVNGKRGITPDSALRFAKYFGTTAELWMRLQSDHDLYCARRDTWPQIQSGVQMFSAAETETELEALRATDGGRGTDSCPAMPLQDSRTEKTHELEGRAEILDASPTDEPGGLPEMGQILQFSAPDKSEGRPCAELSTADDQEDLDEATSHSRPAHHPSESLTAEEFDLEPESPENGLEIPDPNEFRFREKQVSAGSPD